MSNVDSFISYQNGARANIGLPVSWQFHNGIAAGSNSVIGWTAGTPALPASTTNVVVLDGQRSQYSLGVDGTGLTKITDTANSQSMTVSNDTYVVLNGGSAISTGPYAGNPAVYGQIMFVEDAAGSQIARLYEATFGRTPDLPGVEQWINAYRQNVAGYNSMDAVAAKFIISNEFVARYGANTTDTQFVTALYNNVLGRDPDANGLAGWLSVLSNGSQSRVQVLNNFVTSQEEITHSSSWLVDTSRGGYADVGSLISAQTVLNQAETTKYINTALVDISAGATVVYSSDATVTTSGSMQIMSSGTCYISSAHSLTAFVDNYTIIMSNSVNDVTVGAWSASGGRNNTIYTNQNGASNVSLFGSDNTIIIVNTGQKVTITSQGAYSLVTGPYNETVYNFIPGLDVYKTPLVSVGNLPITMLDASGGQAFNGASLQFASNTYVLKLGSVGAGTAAEVAAAAQSAYTASGTTAGPYQHGENLVIVGQTTAGDAVVYDWANWQPTNSNGPLTASADSNGNHRIDVNELALVVRLAGVHVASLTAHDF